MARAMHGTLGKIALFPQKVATFSWRVGGGSFNPIH